MTNITINTLPKGVVFDTNNNTIGSYIREINKIVSIFEGSAEVFEAMEADGLKITLNTDGEEKEFFFEPTSNAPGIDCLHYSVEPTDEELFFISLACEAIFGKSGNDIGSAIDKINKIPVIKTNEDLENLNAIIDNIQDLIDSGDFYPKSDLELLEDYVPIVFTAKSSKTSASPNLVSLFTDGYAVSNEEITQQENTPSESTSQQTAEEIASAVAVSVEEKENTIIEEVIKQPSLVLIKNEEPVAQIQEVVKTEEVTAETPQLVIQESLFDNSTSQTKISAFTEEGFNPLSLVLTNFDSVYNLDELDMVLNSTELDLLEVGDLIEFANNINFNYKDIANVCGKHYSTIYKLQSRSYIIKNSKTAKNDSLILIVNAIGKLLMDKFGGFVIKTNGKITNTINKLFESRDDAPKFVSVPSKNAPIENQITAQNTTPIQQPTVGVANSQPFTSTQQPVTTAPLQQMPTQFVAQQPVVSVVESVGPKRPVVLPSVEANSIVKVYSILTTISLMEAKQSKINPNVSVLKEVIENFLELDSPNRELVQNLYAVVSSLQFKKEHYSELLFKTSVSVASSICDKWIDAFKSQSPDEAKDFDSLFEIFKKQKQLDLSGHIYTLEELKVLRPKFFDDSWIAPLLKKFDIAKVVIEEIITKRAEMREFLVANHLNDIILIPDDFKFIGKASKVRRAINNVNSCEHTLISGDTGCGKTTLIQGLSALTNKPLYTINGNKNTSSEAFLGFNTLTDNEIEFVTGLAIRAMTTGGILYVDETNTVKENVLTILYPILDGRGEVYNDFTGEFVVARKGFVFFGSYNPGYAGTNEISAALIGRTLGLKLGYMSSQELEAYLTRLEPSIDPIMLKKLSAIFKLLTENLGGIELPAAAKSTRHIISLVSKLKDNRQTLAESLEDILDNLPEDDASLVYNALSTIKGVLGIEVSGTSIIQKSL